MKIYPTLYQYDVLNRLRVWCVEQDTDKYRTVSGVRGGSMVVSTWKQAVGKNIGKANETTPEQQASAEIVSLYTKKQKASYYSSIEEAKYGSRYFEPMLAAKYADQKGIKFPCHSQPKLDGIRCIISKQGMYSRSGEEIISCPHIYEEVKYLFDTNPDLILDGELYNHSLKEDFNKITSLIKTTKNITAISLAETASLVEYHIYDFYSETETFSMRNKMLNVTFMDSFNMIKQVSTFLCKNQEELDESYQTYLMEGYEGQMIRSDSVYENKRTKSLIKRKEFMDEEFPILSITEGKGNWSGMAKSVEIQLKNGESCSSGIRGTQEYMRQVLKNQDKYIGKLATVRFQNYTPDGKLRFPVVVQLDRTM